MGGERISAPLGSANNAPGIDAGTLARSISPTPGPTGLTPPGTANSPSPGTAAGENDPEIEALDLAPKARAAAYQLKKAHPSVKFTSGRRNKEDQARAMASNVVKNRKWIEQTYASSDLRKKCQDWVDANPDKKTQAEIAEGLLSLFNAATDAELGKFSKHLSGSAFDVQPVDTDADAIKKTIRALPDLDKFLDTEGGLTRWHAQFK
ncbi:MAG: hypothetical protein KF778_14500 [Rhodocyclaceae bacterium]|nr:hypothetical protein [Rhodocyclaceae bacterium]